MRKNLGIRKVKSLGHDKDKCLICGTSKIMEICEQKLSEDEFKYLESIIDALWDIVEDADYMKAIFDGSFPSAVEKLTVALERAKEIRGTAK